jgi:exonuclease VII small subunit
VEKNMLDRIEALTAKLDDLQDRLDAANKARAHVMKIALKKQAKLAKAVEGLGNIARQKKTAQIEAKGETEFSDYEGAYDMCIDVARATLAEIEGEKT